MKKRLTNILLSILSVLFLFPVNAQLQPEGTWNIFPAYSTPPQKVIEMANEKVYYLTGGNLFSYDNKENENYSYTTGNKLNDIGITNIYYNYDRRYLVVCYESGNIDLIYDDGSVKNMSDIKDSSITPPLTIKNVAFDGDRIYVATSFGIVVFNEPRAEVVTSGNYGKTVNAIAVMGNRLIIHTERYFYWIDKNLDIKSLDKFARLYTHNAPTEIIPISDNQMLIQLSNPQYVLALHTINFETGNMVGWKTFTKPHTKLPAYMIHGADGKIYYQADDAIYTVSDDFEEVMVTSLPEELKDGLIGFYSSVNSLWSLNKRGLGHYSLEENGGMTVLMDRFLPDAFSVSQVRYFYPSADGKRLYAQNSGNTVYRFGGGTRGLDVAQTAGFINLSDGHYEDVTAYPVYAKAPIIVGQQRTYGNYAISPNGLAEYPADPSVYFLSTADDGIYKVKDGEVIGRYDSDNSPLILNDNRHIIYGISIDRGGNLWVIMNTKSYTNPPLMILPADKLKLDPSEITEEDWIHPDLRELDYWGGQDVQILHCRKSNMTFIIQSSGELLVCDNRGTLNNFSDDRYFLWEEYTDQDEKTIKPKFIMSIAEDANGKVWLGTAEGILEINPANALNPNMKVTRLKVPRNDGSNLADYLLGTESVYSISPDVANRKWIATYGSGLFLVSPDGKEILKNFTSDNSPLPSDKVNCVFADPNGPTVYVGTDQGLLSYTSDATPAHDDLSEVFVYPNPVKADYRGDVNITGLMDNTLVKIADTAGSVIFQGKSEGGRFRWNGCNAAGRRVPTGVYYVLASHGGVDNSSSASVVTKIMVVN